MFAKKKDTASAAAFTPLARLEPAVQPAAPRPKSASMIVHGMAIDGDLMGEGELHLDGVLRGDIKVGKLVLGPNARVEGALHAQVIEIHGRVTGSVQAKQVRLYANAVVDGDITHEQLAMEAGAQFQGRSLRFQRSAPAAVQPG
jgi:cytoskeletal protein CcmA (bactofilin family)